MHINCYAKTVMFSEFVEDENMCVSTKQVKESVRDGVQVLVMLASLEVKGKGVVCDLRLFMNSHKCFLKTSMICR